jgi:bifunctional DNA-binding transcriptional regulator/antitoxin component of YhaV-PrlF toxin-antitoxin module
MPGQCDQDGFRPLTPRSGIFQIKWELLALVGTSLYPLAMPIFRLSVKDKGRLLIPAALRVQSGLGDEVELVATPLPEGGFTIKTRQQILDALRTPNTDLVEDEVVIDFLRSRDEAEQARYQFLMNPVIPELSEEEQSQKEAAILEKLELRGAK